VPPVFVTRFGAWAPLDRPGAVRQDRGSAPEEMPMQDMQGDKCPFAFNFDPASFKVGDVVSYRVPSEFQDFPFVGVLLEVHADHVILASDPNDPKDRMRATRESRPVVAADQLA
jgi:hypothetical protein